MQDDYRNIYKNARVTAGLTQERWAEQIGCSPESVRNYEAGTQIPSNRIVRAMCEVAVMPVLAYWHLCSTSELAADALPEVEQLPLPQAMLQLLCALDDFNRMHGDLIRLAADGKITPDEAVEWKGVLARCDVIIQAAIQVKVAEGGGR